MNILSKPQLSVPVPILTLDAVIFFFLSYVEILDHIIIHLADYPTKFYWVVAWCSFHHLVLGPGLWHVLKDPIGMNA